MMRSDRIYRALWVCVLILASVLRLYRIGLYEFQGDEFYIHHLAKELAGGNWDFLFSAPPAGWSGAISIHSPLSVYINALGYAIFPSPESARIIVALMGIGAVLVMMWVMRRYWGDVAALSTGTMMAVFPLLVDQSRFSWNPSIGLLFISLWFATALIGFYDGKRWAQIVFWLCLSAVIQSQTVMLYLLPMSLMLVIYHYWQTRDLHVWLNMAIGFVLMLISFIPWGIGLVQAQSDPSVNESTLVFALPDFSTIVFWVSHMSSSVVSYIAFRTELNTTDLNWFPPSALDNVYYVQAIFIVIIAGILLWRGLRDPQTRLLNWFIALMLFYPLGITVVSISKGIVPYYLYPMSFAAVALFGIGVAMLWQRFEKLRFVIVIASIALISAQLWMSVALLRWFDVDARRAPDRVPLYVLNDARATWEATNEDVVFIIEGREYYNPTQQAWLWNAITADNTSDDFRVVVMPSGVPIAPNGTVIASAYPARTLALLEGDTRELGERLNTGSPLYVWREVFPDDLPALTHRPIGASQFANGAEIIGISAAQTGATWGVMLQWQPSEMPSVDYHFSLRLMDGEGNRLAQVDSPSLASVIWRPDDIVFNTFYLDTGDQSYDASDIYFDLVFYQYPDVIESDVINADGQAVGQVMNISAVP